MSPGKKKVSESNNVIGKDDSLAWPTEDIKRLIERMQDQIPQNDHFRHQTTAENLAWEEICFDKYTSDECYHMWKLVLQRIRGFRLLHEVLEDARNWLDRPWTNYYGSESKNRHPGKPKQPSNAYIIFSKENGKLLREENPNIKQSDLQKLISEAYHNLSPKKKGKYVKKADLSKHEYERKLKIFLEENPLEDTPTKTKKKSKIKPTKKVTAFNLYFENEVKINPNLVGKKFKEQLSFFRDQWESFPNSEKMVWMELAERKQKSIKEALETDEIEAEEVTKPVFSKKELLDFDKVHGKPNKPPATVYNLFTKLTLLSGELQDFESKDRMKQVSDKWKCISAEEKQELTERLHSEQEEYKAKYAEFLDSLEPDVREHYEQLSITKKKPSASKVKSTPAKTTKNIKTKSAEFVGENFQEHDKSMTESETAKKKKNISKHLADDEVVAEENTYEDVKAISSPKKKKRMADQSAAVDESYLSINNEIMNEDETPRKKKKKSKKDIEVVQPEEMTAQEDAVDSSLLKIKKKKSKVTFVPETHEQENYESPKITKRKKKNKDFTEENNQEEPQEEEITLIEKIQPELERENNSDDTPRSKKKKRAADIPEEPKEPPRNVMEHFAEIFKKTNKSATEDELTEAWDNLSSKEQKKYNKELEKTKKAYLTNFEVFLTSLTPRKLQKYLDK